MSFIRHIFGFTDAGGRSRAVVVCLALGIAAFIVVVLMARSWSLGREMLMVDADVVLSKPTLAAYALDRGRTVFTQSCAVCHGVNGKADRAIGIPDLTDHDYLYGDGRASDIEDIVTHGIRAGNRRGRNAAYMPAYASVKPYAAEPIPPLSPSETRDVVQDLLQRGGRPADAAAAARGHALYLGKAGCYDCHGGDAKGDPAIGAPNLTDAIWLYGNGSEAAITASILQGRKGYSPAFKGRLSAADIRAVAVYVASLSKDLGHD